MSAFGTKRKPRIIQSFDDDVPSVIGGEEASKDVTVPIPQGPIKFRSKPAKSSSLRKSINFNDNNESQAGASAAPVPTISSNNGDDEEAGVSVVIRPGLSRSGSTKQKKRASTSRLSFGPGGSEATGAGAAPDADEEAGPEGAFTPKKTLGQRALQNNALRKSASFQNLAAVRFGGGVEEDRPRYSKEYLEELQSSTPNTPQNISSLLITDDSDDFSGDVSAAPADTDPDVMELDPSELDGALVLQTQDLTRRSPSLQALTTRPSAAAANILTEAEIRERKERRLRLAQEAEFISLEGDSDDEEEQSCRVSVRFDSAKNKKTASESRLIAEDEDLGEGYDEFVLDGGLALGRKAEREAEKRHRQEMAELIRAAEDGSDAESDDSEAERRAAYEAAQRRAGMDGLQRLDDEDADMDGGGGVNMIPRMKPLPELDEVLQRMRNLVQGLEDEAARKRVRIAALEKEREEILTRENEVQEILNQAGAKYQAVMGSAAGDIAKLVTQSPLRPLPPGMAGDLPVERGLESFGTPVAMAGELPTERGLESFGTPTKRPDVEMT
ncbi:nineteen complex-related protein 2-domain-containing protein [Podospora didyma]|uniref:Nineteen complex-related protein 2-domain-containing protein n=1 Tax=Podospora didyma TaxID=330526 RepID=A0AAE0P3J9_9PEZI|nr:nineteen complex-related protein 2-domain-containing protein [Podospora didyma]